MIDLRNALQKTQSPFQQLPESRLKQKIRILLWRYGSAGIIHRKIHLLRRPLLITPGDNVILVGCSGNQTLREVSELVDSTGSVLIIEPDSDRRRKLNPDEVNAKVQIDSRAAWSSAERLHFGKQGGDAPSGRVLDSESNHVWKSDDYDKANPIEAAPLSTIADEYDFNPDYIELATNGTEPEVLTGATSLLSSAEVKICIKAHGLAAPHTLDRSHLSLEKLGEIGYEYVFSPIRPLPSKIWGAHPDGDIFAYHQDMDT